MRAYGNHPVGAGRARPLQTAKKPEGPLSPSGIFNILLPLFLLPRLCQMPHRQNGMVEQHPRTAPAHDLADALPHLGLVAVRLAEDVYKRQRKGSYGEDWSLRKVLRRFIWHDRIHARAMYRMAIKVFGAESIVNPFYFFDEGVLT